MKKLFLILSLFLLINITVADTYNITYIVEVQYTNGEKDTLVVKHQTQDLYARFVLDTSETRISRLYLADNYIPLIEEKLITQNITKYKLLQKIWTKEKL